MYREKGFTEMWIVGETQSATAIHMLEAALISHFQDHVGCQNKRDSGGEGALKTPSKATLLCIRDWRQS